jgi:hypothetical protein
VQRRLQHFIDRKIATLFEPLMNAAAGRGAYRVLRAALDFAWSKALVY